MLTHIARMLNSIEDNGSALDAEAGLPYMPEAVLISILQHVPLQQRLASCALVCHAWTAAAAKITANISASLPQDVSTQKMQQMHAWLQRYGCRVASIRLQQSPRVSWPLSQSIPLQLPVAKLTQPQTLDLQGIQVALQRQQSRTSTRSSTNRKRVRSGSSPQAGSSSIPAATPTVHVVPQLRSLRLHSCQIPINSFVLLSQLCSPTVLSVVDPTVPTSKAFSRLAEGDRLQAAIPGILGQLGSLKQLQLTGFRTAGGCCVLDPGVLCPISTMQHLQDLSVELTAKKRPNSLAFLPTTLTALKLIGKMYFSPLTVPQHQQMSGLQSLALRSFSKRSHWACINLATLYSCPHLTQLHLAHMLLQLEAPAAMPKDYSYTNDDGSHAVEHRGWPLAAVSQLTRLQHLELSNVELDLDSDSEVGDVDYQDSFDVDPACFTASTHLTALVLLTGIPQHKLGYLLDPEVCLPQLQKLQLQFMDEGEECSIYPYCPADVPKAFSRLPQCCPALQELHLGGLMCREYTIRSLTQLRGSLTSLRLAGDDGTAGVVAQLTALRSLHWAVRPLWGGECSPGSSKGTSCISQAGLQQLTALRSLTELTLEGWKMRRGVLQPMGSLHFKLQVSEKAATPDVWSQLEELLT